MHQDMVVDVRTGGAPLRPPATAKSASVLKELETAKRIANDLAYSAYGQLDGEGMHSLSMLEGLIAGAIKKLQAPGVTP